MLKFLCYQMECQRWVGKGWGCSYLSFLLFFWEFWLTGALRGFVGMWVSYIRLSELIVFAGLLNILLAMKLNVQSPIYRTPISWAVKFSFVKYQSYMGSF